jgi:hypothetical protein
MAGSDERNDPPPTSARDVPTLDYRPRGADPFRWPRVPGSRIAGGVVAVSALIGLCLAGRHNGFGSPLLIRISFSRVR